MDLSNKLEILKQVAKEMNTQKIHYALGASTMLYFYGIVKDFNDIDLMIDEKDVGKVQAIFSSLGVKKPDKKSEKYKTKYFEGYTVQGLDFDLMAGFTIVSKEKDYYFPLTTDSTIQFYDLDGIRIPLQTIAEWKEYYTLMERTEKVEIIEAFNSRGE